MRQDDGLKAEIATLKGTICQPQMDNAALKARLAEAQRPERADQPGRPTVADLIAAYAEGNSADDLAIGLQGVAALVRLEAAREIKEELEKQSNVGPRSWEAWVTFWSQYGVTE